MAKPEPKRELTDEVYTFAEAAEVLKISQATMRRIIARGELKTCLAGRFRRIHRDALWEFLGAERRLRLADDKEVVRAIDKANDARQKAERDAATARLEVARLGKRLRRERQKGRR